MSSSVTLAVCGAPLAHRTVDLVSALIADGWNVTVVATPAGLAWLDVAQVEKIAGLPPISEHRLPGQAKRGEPPERVVVCPLTLNTGSKVATGIMDNYALGVLCEALAVRMPMLLVTMINERLWQHPNWSRSLDILRAPHVSFLDPRTGSLGEPRPVASGTGGATVARFDPAWVVAALR